MEGTGTCCERQAGEKRKSNQTINVKPKAGAHQGAGGRGDRNFSKQKEILATTVANPPMAQ